MPIDNLFEPVVRQGKYFEIGDYPDKNFSLTEQEFDANISKLTTVHNSIEHLPTIFDGKLGETTRFWRKGKDIYTEYTIPRWLHEVTGGAPLKTSAEWDRETKMPVGNSIVLTPRIRDAAMMGAFNFIDVKPNERVAAFKDYTEKTRQKMTAEDEAMPDGRYPIANRTDVKNALDDYNLGGHDDTVKQWIKKRAKELDCVDVLPDGWKETAKMTSPMKHFSRDFHHRLVDSCGVECKGRVLPAYFSDPHHAQFMTPSELSQAQKWHDQHDDGGKNCDHYKAMNGVGDIAPPRFTNGKEKPMGVFSKIAAFMKGENVIDEDEAEKLKKMDEDRDDDLGTDDEANDKAKKKKDPDDDEIKSEFSAKFARQNELLEAMANELKELKTARMSDSKTAQFRLDCSELDNLVRTGRLTRGEADEYQKMAEEKPASFSDMLPMLRKRPVLAQFGGRPEPIRIKPTQGSPSEQLITLTKAKMKDDKIEYAAAFSAVCRENPELARAHSDDVVSFRAPGPEAN
jgi:uncharacterized membrane-anchored protein YhcB (DUF1043 family)